jgi:hypothetical protein
MRVRLRARDKYTNQSEYVESANFDLDTSDPSISNIVVAQYVGGTDVVITYDLADDSETGLTVALLISEDSGSTWIVSNLNAVGAVGSNQSTGTSKSITWAADTDFDGEYQTDMRISLQATDAYANQASTVESADFVLDTANPVISNLAASQLTNTSTVEVAYDLFDNNSTNLSVELDISEDSGLTWVVTDTSVAGDVGLSQTSGINKSFVWAVGTDFANQEQNDLRVRVRAIDQLTNYSIYYESTDFEVDTQAPQGLASLVKFDGDETEATLSWATGVNDSNFDHFEIWHGIDLSDVQSRSGLASEWDANDDTNLSNINTISTVITGLTLTEDYYVKIWAVDVYGNETTLDEINVYETETVVQAPTRAFGEAKPMSPVLEIVNTPVSVTAVILSGLAIPGVVVEIYDNGDVIGLVSNVVDSSGHFAQEFTFSEGLHNLTARSIESGNYSDFSNEIDLEVDLTAPEKPIITSHVDQEEVQTASQVLSGRAEPLSTLVITINDNVFEVFVSENGEWSFIIPSTFPLLEGDNTIEGIVVDRAGNIGQASTISLTLMGPDEEPPIIVIPSVPGPVTIPGIGVPTTSPEIIPVETVPVVTPIPGVFEEVEISLPLAVVPELLEAVEVASIPVPDVASSAIEQTIPDVFTFSGTALPNQDVIIYVNSERTLVYRTQSDSIGRWSFNHSQEVIELEPGTHTIFAVSVDEKSKVKSAPSPIEQFQVKKNYFVVMFNYLNWKTTLATIMVLVISLVFLYTVRSRKEVIA